MRFLSDILGFAGLTAITVGAFMVYEPAGWIVAGAGALVAARQLASDV